MVSVKARFEGGVLRPLTALDLAEGSTVEVSIVPAAWSEALRTVLDRVRGRLEHMAPEEIGAEITRAADEVRDERLATPRVRRYEMLFAALQRKAQAEPTGASFVSTDKRRPRASRRAWRLRNSGFPFLDSMR